MNTAIEAVVDLMTAAHHPLAKIAFIGFLWAYLHHFCAGIRYLLLDVQQGIELAPARRSSSIVIAISLALTFIAGIRLW